MKKIFPYLIFFSILCFIFVGDLAAQSFFNNRGIGERIFYNNAQSLGMGGTVIALPDIYQINMMNPAGLTFLPVTRLNGDFIHEAVWTKAQAENGFTKNTNLNGICLAIPLKKNTFVTALGISPVSQFDYQFQAAGEIDGYNYSKITKADGGLNKVSFGFGLSPKQRIALGAYFSYTFGRLEKTWKVDYVSDLFWDSSDKLIRKVWGYNFSLGLLVNPASNLYLGATYSFSNKLSFQDQILLTTQKSSLTYPVDEYFEEGNEMTLPAIMGAGVSYTFKKKWRVAADFVHEPWSQFKIDHIVTKNFEDRNRLGMGIEMLPSTNMLAPYYKQMTYRIGSHYQTLEYLDDQGNSVTDFGFSLGFGFPYYNNFGRIDLALCYSQRGDLNSVGIAEDIFQIFISVTGGEIWFVRQGQN